ncbi:cyclin-dependent kinase D-1 [Planoprotostelium fungivorum]|uniref:[RNA-polymerase]-subunit kinase n=1 Tax=Planoprotostelium fungivorum TaxID=1890364 RepID=A0A2P6N7S8_9EUKA|nr:cyclin-dependent kinase D-1 [Planoprotostelium fungivorum]
MVAFVNDLNITYLLWGSERLRSLPEVYVSTFAAAAAAVTPHRNSSSREGFRMASSHRSFAFFILIIAAVLFVDLLHARTYPPTLTAFNAAKVQKTFKLNDPVLVFLNVKSNLQQGSQTAYRWQQAAYMPTVDTFSLFVLNGSGAAYGNASDIFITLSTGGTTESQYRFWKVAAKPLPFVGAFQAVIQMDSGNITDIVWSDGCIGGNNCGITLDDINGNCTANLCDLKVYVAWIGSDSQGYNCRSSASLPNAFSRFSAQSTFKNAAGVAKTSQLVGRRLVQRENQLRYAHSMREDLYAKDLKYLTLLQKKKLGEGTFGVVFLAYSKILNRDVALKKTKIKDPKDGVSFTAIREIKILKDIRHKNVVALYDVFVQKSNIYLVYELMYTDLENVIKDQSTVLIEAAAVKTYMKMLLEGIVALHSAWVLHRDLKPNNLLIGTDGTLKIADFGFAKPFGSPDPRFTPEVVTRWYRAPELLFGAKQYGSAIDMWSVGCIFAELMLRGPYLPGSSDLDQLTKIFSALGTPTEEQWPDRNLLSNYIKFQPAPAPPLKQLFTAATNDALDLLSQFFKFNPLSRITAQEALKHPYFSSEPAPLHPSKLKLPSSPEEESNKRQLPLDPASEERSFKRRTLNNGEEESIKRKLFS